MRKLVVFGLAIAAAALCVTASASAQHRGYVAAPQFHQQVVPQYYQAPSHINPGIYNHVAPGVPQHFGNVVGRHGLPLVQGIHGLHEAHNRTRFALIPGHHLIGGGYDSGVDFDSFIDTIEVSTPLEPLDPCDQNCNVFAAMSVSNDGFASWSWNFATSEAAKQSALNNCVQSATMVCNTNTVNGSGWLAGIHCANEGAVWGWAVVGSDGQAAVRNAYRVAAQQLGFSPNECAVVALVAGDGSQQQFVQQE